MVCLIVLILEQDINLTKSKILTHHGHKTLKNYILIFNKLTKKCNAVRTKLFQARYFCGVSANI